MFFKKVDPRAELAGLDKAIEVLNDSYQKKLITLEEFNKKAITFGKRKEKCLKKIAKLENKEQ